MGSAAVFYEQDNITLTLRHIKTIKRKPTFNLPSSTKAELHAILIALTK